MSNAPRMLPILPLLFLLLFPHASALRSVEVGAPGGRHELRLLARAVQSVAEESEPAGAARARSVPERDAHSHDAPSAAAGRPSGDRTRDGPRG